MTGPWPLCKQISGLEKVLGYKYNPKLDTFQIFNTDIDNSVNSKKRGVLSQTAKVFDPVYPCDGQSKGTPTWVMVLKFLWSLKLSWDDMSSDSLLEC